MGLLITMYNWWFMREDRSNVVDLWGRMGAMLLIYEGGWEQCCWSMREVGSNVIMPYYGLFSGDLHILDLQWRLPLCSLLFCEYYPCVHYFYVPWLIMTSQWLMTLLRMPHCGTIMGNDVARDIHCDTTMDNDVVVGHNMASQWIMTLLGTSFALYYYAKLWYCCFTSKLFKIVHINH